MYFGLVNGECEAVIQFCYDQFDFVVKTMNAFNSNSSNNKVCSCSQYNYKYMDSVFFETLFLHRSTDGSVVEFSPATREARVRFPVSA